MADMTERTTNEATALNEATDRVIREMTQVHVSDDAVQRVMARVRAASDTERAAATADRFGGFGALFAPRVSWGMMAATAALAAIVAAGVTLVAVRATSHGDGTALTASVAPPNPAAPVVSPVRRTQTTPRPGIDQSVGAAMVMTPDEDPPRAAQQQASLAAAAGAVAPLPPNAIPQDVRVDVTITDQSGTAKPITKIVNLIVADRESGSIRSETRVPIPHRPLPPAGSPVTLDRWDWETLPLMVNVWPVVMPDGHVRVKMTLSYRTTGVTPGSEQGPLSTAIVNKDLTAMLSDGKPLVVSTSADAATDRKVTVEMKATIQK